MSQRCPTCDALVEENPGTAILILRLLRAREAAEIERPITTTEIRDSLLRDTGVDRKIRTIRQVLLTLAGQGDIEKRRFRLGDGTAEGWMLVAGRYLESVEGFTSAPMLNTRAPESSREVGSEDVDSANVPPSDVDRLAALREQAEEMSALIRAVQYILNKQGTTETREEVILNVMRDVHDWDEVKASLAIHEAITTGRLVQSERGFVALPTQTPRNIMDDIEGENS